MGAARVDSRATGTALPRALARSGDIPPPIRNRIVSPSRRANRNSPVLPNPTISSRVRVICLMLAASTFSSAIPMEEK